jgi:hypothetical protein
VFDFGQLEVIQAVSFVQPMENGPPGGKGLR